MRTVKRLYCPFTALLLPAEGDMVRLSEAWASADQCSEFGLYVAARRFPGQVVEVVVVDVTTDTAVSNVYQQEESG